MNKAKKYIAVFWPAAVIIFALIVGYNIYSGEIRILDAGLADIRESMKKIETDLANSQEIIDAYNESRISIRPYTKMMFPSIKPDALIAEIDDKAASHGARLANIEFDVPKFIEIRGKKEAISIVPFKISFAGGFFSLGKLLSDFEKAPYLQNIADLGLVSRTDSGRNLELSVKGAFRFFQKETVEELESDED